MAGGVKLKLRIWHGLHAVASMAAMLKSNLVRQIETWHDACCMLAKGKREGEGQGKRLPNARLRKWNHKHFEVDAAIQVMKKQKRSRWKYHWQEPDRSVDNPDTAASQASKQREQFGGAAFAQWKAMLSPTGLPKALWSHKLAWHYWFPGRSVPIVRMKSSAVARSWTFHFLVNKYIYICVCMCPCLFLFVYLIDFVIVYLFIAEKIYVYIKINIRVDLHFATYVCIYE